MTTVGPTLLIITALDVLNNVDPQLIVSTLSGQVTYPGIGTFTTHDFEDPIYRPVVMLPQSPEIINTSFALYTKTNPTTGQPLQWNDTTSITSSNFNGTKPTKFIVPGFVDDPDYTYWQENIKDQYLYASDCNVVVVSWRGGNFNDYIQAVSNARVVGAVIGNLINDLKNVTGLNLSDVHLLGHSLGAHIVGTAGERLNGQVGRITGFDPAGPYYQGLNYTQAKLDPSDGQFVDVIHTDAKYLIPNFGLGINETSGHLDFWPNNGVDQPGCVEDRVTTILTNGVNVNGPEVTIIVSCDHQRSWAYYLASMNFTQFNPMAYECSDYEAFQRGDCQDCGAQGENCAILGEQAILSSQFKNLTMGKRFYLMTTDSPPYFIENYEFPITSPPPLGLDLPLGVPTG